MFKQAVAICAFCAAGALADTYTLVKEYQGDNFFDDWTFYNKFDNLTNGDVVYVSASKGKSDKLAYVADSGNAIIKVDNTSTVALDEKRNSVRISSNDRFTVGSTWVIDMLHAPYGCSVWPGFWSTAPSWPSGGEIDTFEGVNQVTMNQMSLHTNPGCTQADPVQSSTLVNSTDCSFEANSNSGCTVTVPSTASFGPGFAAAGGGVYVTEYAASGISVWFFPRASVPTAISSNSSSIDVSALGKPTANWPTGGCDMSKFFSAQELIFDITLCGDFAGNAATFAETCSGECYEDFVVGDGSNYATAYFEVQSLRVYGSTANTVIQAAGAPPARANPGVWAVAAAALLAGAVAAW